MKKKAVIFDIDGTLANGDHRVHHVRGKPKNWPAYNDGMAEDKVHEHTKLMFHALTSRNFFDTSLSDQEIDIFIVSGREDQFKEVTERWLFKNSITPYHGLYMRKTGDYRSDDIVKEEILLTELKDYAIVCVFDDRPRVIRMWRKNGIPVFNCGDGTEF